MRGSITVKAYQGKDIIVEARVREKALAGYTSAGNYYTGPYAAVAPPTTPAPPVKPGQPVPPPAPAPATGAEVRAHTEQELATRELEQQERLAKRIEREYARAAGVYGQSMQDEQKAREEKAKKTAGMKQLANRLGPGNIMCCAAVYRYFWDGQGQTGPVRRATRRGASFGR